MTKVCGLILAALTVGLFAMPAQAGNCGVRQKVVVQEAVVVKQQVVVAQDYFIPKVAVYAIPLYSAGYYPYPYPYGVPQAPQQPPATAELREKNSDSALLAEIKKLNSRLDSMEARLTSPLKQMEKLPEVPEPQSNQGGGDGAKVVISNCARCHDVSVAASLGKGIKLSSGGKLLDWDSDLTLRVIREVDSGRMPKGSKKLTDTEGSAIMDYIHTMKLASRKE